MQWQLLSDRLPQTTAEFRQLLLNNRGITDPDLFFNPPSPLEFELEMVGIARRGVLTAIDRLWNARENQEQIVIFGDYDADGIGATALTWRVLHDLGCQCVPFIPDRFNHGYGLSVKALDEIVATYRPAVVVTVDNGIVAHQAAEWLQEQGIDLIISDHHQPEIDALPPALAIVHTTQLCGSTVAWMFMKEVAAEFTKRGVGRDAASDMTTSVAPSHDLLEDHLLADQLDLCGIATIADQVPLMGANRSFAFHGIRALRQTKRLGLLALYTAASLDATTITETTINYGLAPRINAMGRLRHGLEALRLLCTNSSTKAARLAADLSTTNLERQELTSDLLALARYQAEAMSEQRILVVHSERFHEGVIGLIAGRLVEEFGKPAIVVSVGETVSKGSARSLPQVNIVELIRTVKEHLLEVGGHPMAAGFGLDNAKLELVTSLLQAQALEQIAEKDLEPVLEVECLVPASLVTAETVASVSSFAPFGQGNRPPVVALKNLHVLDAVTMGKDHQHLRLAVTSPDMPEQVIKCVGWGMGDRATQLHLIRNVNIAGVIEANIWNGRTTIQVSLKDLQVSDEPSQES